jgi:hypothetical protein
MREARTQPPWRVPASTTNFPSNTDCAQARYHAGIWFDPQDIRGDTAAPCRCIPSEASPVSISSDVRLLARRGLDGASLRKVNGFNQKYQCFWRL